MSPTEIISRPPGLIYAHRAFEITAFRFDEVHGFGQPITITLHYSATDVIGLKRETLRLWYRNGIGEPWAMLGEPVRVMSGTLRFLDDTFHAVRVDCGEHIPGVCATPGTLSQH
jgi:hypothetical protein